MRRAEHARLLARERDEEDVAPELLRAWPASSRAISSSAAVPEALSSAPRCGSVLSGRQRVAPAEAEVVVVRADHDGGRGSAVARLQKRRRR